jgi:hypothetical protein
LPESTQILQQHTPQARYPSTIAGGEPPRISKVVLGSCINDQSWNTLTGSQIANLYAVSLFPHLYGAARRTQQLTLFIKQACINR